MPDAVAVNVTVKEPPEVPSDEAESWNAELLEVAVIADDNEAPLTVIVSDAVEPIANSPRSIAAGVTEMPVSAP